MANTKDRERTLAQALYLSGQYTQKQIASMVDVTEKTIGVWVEGGHWEKLRAAGQSTISQVVSNLIEIHLARTEQILTEVRGGSKDKFGDELLKMSKAIEELQSGISLSTIIQVLQEFMGFVGDKDHKFRAQLAGYQNEFLNKKAGANG
jgi:transposase